MGFGIFKKIKNGNKSVAGRLKKKVMTENAVSSVPSSVSSWKAPSWNWGEPVAAPKIRPISKNKDFPDLRFK